MTASSLPPLSLRVTGGANPGVETEVGEGIFVLGRDPDADLTFAGVEETVSPRHATIRREGGRWILRDEASANGTFINDRRVHEQELRSGDTIELGLGGPTVEVTLPTGIPTPPRIPPQKAVTPAEEEAVEPPPEEEPPRAAEERPVRHEEGAGPAAEARHTARPESGRRGKGRTALILLGLVTVSVAVVVALMMVEPTTTGGPGANDGGETGSSPAAGVPAATTSPDETGSETEDPLKVLEEQAAGFFASTARGSEEEAAEESFTGEDPAEVSGTDGPGVAELRRMAREREASVVLLQTGVRVNGRYIPGRTGSGFFVSDDGRAVTSRHLAMAHRFARVREEATWGCAVQDLQRTGAEAEFVLSAWVSGTPVSYLPSGALDPESASHDTDSGSLDVLAAGVVEDGSSAMEVPCGAGDGEPAGSVEIFSRHPGDDIALLGLTGEGYQALPLAEGEASVDDALVALGFPGALLPSEGEAPRPSASIGVLRAPDDPLVVADRLWPGADGSPVLNGVGEVVGVATLAQSEDLFLAVRARYVRDLLERSP